MASEPDQGLAAKLNRLFSGLHPRGRGPYTYEEVARAINARGGPKISAGYIGQLCNGLRSNPTKRHLEALADFFGVSPAYFFDGPAEDRISAQLELLATIRDSRVNHIALRAFGLSDASLSGIQRIIERLRWLERLSYKRPPEGWLAELDVNGSGRKGRLDDG